MRKPLAETMNEAVRTFPKGIEQPEWMQSLSVYRRDQKAAADKIAAAADKIAADAYFYGEV